MASAEGPSVPDGISVERSSFIERGASLASLEQQGYLLKRSEYLHKWNKRWFALDAVYTHALYYYEKEEKLHLTGSYAITAEATIESDPSSNEFTLHSDGKVIVVKAETEKEKMEWITSIKYVIDMEQSRVKSAGVVPTSTRTRPLVSRALNTACIVPKAFSIGRWGTPNTIESAVRAAKENVGTDIDTDILDEKRMVSMYSLCRRLGLERSGARYTPFGHYMVLEGLIHKVTMRLKLLDYFKRHPSIENVSLGPGGPVFVIGLNGSGEASLHSLLSTHTDFSTHYTWEQLDPVPGTHDESKEAQSADRMSRHQRNKKLFARALVASGVGEDMNSLHDIDYDGPEECTIPCAMELPWSILEIPFNAYAAREIMAMGAGGAFPLYKKYLQLLTWQSDRLGKDSLWLLHSPHHLPYIKDIHDTFPNATYVWTHRHPADCIATICAVYDMLLLLVMKRSSINRAALGRAVLEYTRECLRRASSSIRQLESKIKIVHICLPDGDNFSHVDADRMKATCRAVLSSAGVTYQMTFDANLTRHIADLRAASSSDNDLGKNLQLYGLSRELIDPYFTEYIEEYVRPVRADSYLIVGSSLNSSRSGDEGVTTNARHVEDGSVPSNNVVFFVLVLLLVFNGSVTLVCGMVPNMIPTGKRRIMPQHTHTHHMYCYVVYFPENVSTVLSIGNMLIAGVALCSLSTVRIVSRISKTERQAESAHIPIATPALDNVHLASGDLSTPHHVLVDAASPPAGDWKLRFSGKWKNTRSENTDEWFSKMNNFGFIVRVFAAKKLLTLQKEIKVEKIRNNDADEYIFHVERSFAGKEKYWKEHMPIGKIRDPATAKRSICDGALLDVYMWADESEQILHMFFEPVESGNNIRLVHSRRIVDDNHLEMVCSGAIDL